MTILEPILVDFIPFALLKRIDRERLLYINFEILIKQERTKSRIKESQSPPKPSKTPQKKKQKGIKITF
ncbi:hypothetical protein [Helicobacter pylori]|uniref:hypothetical protein n=1 Tax=Helicobacter pylori TaxID=210 RepID=UPI001967E336|nr:hypothetical protein [Helicobacter pylori]